MKKTFFGFLLAALLGFNPLAQATLWDRGGGLIYDDVLNITWMQDANYAGERMIWDDAMTWASNLVYQGYDDWRLPTTIAGPNEFESGYDGTTNGGFNVKSSEMGYMYYVTLGNKGYYALDGTNPRPGWGLVNTSFKSGGPGASHRLLPKLAARHLLVGYGASLSTELRMVLLLLQRQPAHPRKEPQPIRLGCA